MLEALIPPQNFELVRDRLAFVLQAELENQQYLGADIIVPTIYIERGVPFNDTELPAINIQYSGGAYGNKDVTQVQGTYTYYIDVMAQNSTVGIERGDALAMIAVQRIAGLIRAILDNPLYITLGFSRPSLGHVECSSMQIADRGDTDAKNSAMARVLYTAQVAEGNQLITAPEFAAAYSTIKIDVSDAGFMYITNN